MARRRPGRATAPTGWKAAAASRRGKSEDEGPAFAPAFFFGTVAPKRGESPSPGARFRQLDRFIERSRQRRCAPSWQRLASPSLDCRRRMIGGRGYNIKTAVNAGLSGSFASMGLAQAANRNHRIVWAGAGANTRVYTRERFDQPRCRSVVQGRSVFTFDITQSNASGQTIAAPESPRTAVRLRGNHGAAGVLTKRMNRRGDGQSMFRANDEQLGFTR